MYSIKYTKQAVKDKEKLKTTPYYAKAKKIVEILKKNPYQISNHFEKLVGNLCGQYSRHISYTHRVVYEIDDKEKIVRINTMWSHYEKN